MTDVVRLAATEGLLSIRQELSAPIHVTGELLTKPGLLVTFASKIFLSSLLPVGNQASVGSGFTVAKEVE